LERMERKVGSGFFRERAIVAYKKLYITSYKETILPSISKHLI
jgi:hypothetical protein